MTRNVLAFLFVFGIVWLSAQRSYRFFTNGNNEAQIRLVKKVSYGLLTLVTTVATIAIFSNLF